MPLIPYGTKYTATVSGSVWKPVTCENCGCEYAYQIKHQTSGSATNVLWLNKERAIRDAENHARQNLQSYLNNTMRNYHCPDCGFYQTSTIHDMKNVIWQRAIFFGFIALVIAAFVTASSSHVMLFSLTAGIFVSIALLSPLRNFNPNVNARSRTNQQFSEKYPVVKKEKTESILTDSVIEKMKPFAVELFERVSAGEYIDVVAKSIAKRASLSPDQVVAFGIALTQALKEKRH